MAKSTAKKMREKLAREGKRNPEENRYRNVGLYTRKVKDKTKYTRKERLSLDGYYGDSGSFYIA